MTVADGSPFDRPRVARLRRLAPGVIAPLAAVAAAYALWWISDRLVVIGPLDRAAFGWIVVIPVWLSAPIVAGFVWSGLGRSDTRVVAIVVGSVIGTVAAAMFGRSVSSSVCEYGARQTSAETLIASLILGIVIGGGVVLSGLLAAGAFRRGRPWQALVLGAAAEFGLVFVAILVAGIALMGMGCQRPPL
jgi:hypothetical protein